VKTGLTNLAHLGIEDFMNDTFTDYSSTLFPFEEVRTEMDYIRGKRAYGGKVSLKKFIESLMMQAERTLV
jgi:two-component system response regulator YcbB